MKVSLIFTLDTYLHTPPSRCSRLESRSARLIEYRLKIFDARYESILQKQRYNQEKFKSSRGLYCTLGIMDMLVRTIVQLQGHTKRYSSALESITKMKDEEDQLQEIANQEMKWF